VSSTVTKLIRSGQGYVQVLVIVKDGVERIRRNKSPDKKPAAAKKSARTAKVEVATTVKRGSATKTTSKNRVAKIDLQATDAAMTTFDVPGSFEDSIEIDSIRSIQVAADLRELAETATRLRDLKRTAALLAMTKKERKRILGPRKAEISTDMKEIRALIRASPQIDEIGPEARDELPIDEQDLLLAFARDISTDLAEQRFEAQLSEEEVESTIANFLEHAKTKTTSYLENFGRHISL
jgi:hypothetical protein